jgi:hypothetical protein
LTARPSIFWWSTGTVGSADWRRVLFFDIYFSGNGFCATGPS